MADIDKNMPIIPLSSIADILKVKTRTLRMYEEKRLLPRHTKYHNTSEKKLYSLNDIPMIELVHYLAGYKKVNANGIRYILECFHQKLNPEQREALIKEAQEAIAGAIGEYHENIEDLESL